MRAIGEMTLEDAARGAAGNWGSWTCFVWEREREIEDAENWSIIYTHNRDSGLLEKSNAAVIADVLRPFSETENPDVVFESHSHWAVGHVDGLSMRVYRDGDITDAFRTYHELMARLDGYPVLDEADYCHREYEAAIENIEDATWRFKSTYDLHDGWEAEVYQWLSAHRPGALENKDDRGAYPSEHDLLDAFSGLGYVRHTA
jgi:hypothetical protein